MPGTLPPICRSAKPVSFLQSRASRNVSLVQASRGMTDPVRRVQYATLSSSRCSRAARGASVPVIHSQYATLRCVRVVTREKGRRFPSSVSTLARSMRVAPCSLRGRRSAQSRRCPQPRRFFLGMDESHPTSGAVSSPDKSRHPPRFSSVSAGSFERVRSSTPPAKVTSAPSVIRGKSGATMTGILKRLLRRGNL